MVEMRGQVVESINLSYARYSELLRAERELAALEEAGVDNWDGYGEIDWEALDDE